MRRKSEMWQEINGSFLVAEGEQDAMIAAIELGERLSTLEDRLKSQFTSMSAYHQMALQLTETARAESRADLDREKAMLICLVERVREECARTAVAAPEPEGASSVADRLELLEDRFGQLGDQVALCLRSQQELANSIALVFEQQVRNSSLGGATSDSSVRTSGAGQIEHPV